MQMIIKYIYAHVCSIFVFKIEKRILNEIVYVMFIILINNLQIVNMSSKSRRK
jgi:hypothetical protein